MIRAVGWPLLVLVVLIVALVGLDLIVAAKHDVGRLWLAVEGAGLSFAIVGAVVTAYYRGRLSVWNELERERQGRLRNGGFPYGR
jgi:hypothetical protein